MKNTILLFTLFSLSVGYSKSIIKIEIGQDYKNYSNKELRRRLWNLERAVWQLQQRVFHLEASDSTPAKEESWICKVSAMGENFSELGTNKSIATHKVLEKCKGKIDSFFCKDPVCEKAM